VPGPENPSSRQVGTIAYRDGRPGTLKASTAWRGRCRR
jgi:hypothetical protein